MELDGERWRGGGRGRGGRIVAAAAAAPSQRGFALHQILLPYYRLARPLQNQNRMDFRSNTFPPLRQGDLPALFLSVHITAHGHA